MTEFETKQARIQALLARHRLDALVLRQVSNFAWATCGAASYVNTATSTGEATLVMTPAGRYLITNNIEATRLDLEEGLAAQGWDLRVGPWYETSPVLGELTRGLRVGADVPLPGAVDLAGDLTHLRSLLLPVEQQRYRELGKICAGAMNAAVRAVKPGMSEHEIGAHLAFEAERRGAQAIVNLIATDERIFRFRHPLPTAKKLERYAMLVLCARRLGLVCSITRLVHFGVLPAELRRKAEAVARVDATFMVATRPGARWGDILAAAQRAYADVGFGDEWTLHHQGGPAGYAAREGIATPGAADTVAAGQAYAWNPSITGTKSEDTILVGEAANEVLTAIDDWPVLAIELAGHIYERPAILETTP